MNIDPASGGMHPFTQFVTIAAAVLVGGTGAMFAQHLLAPPDAPRAVGDSAPAAATDPQLVEALTQLAQELAAARKRETLQPAPSPEPSARSVATESGEGALAELAVAIRELRQALQQGSGPIAGVDRVVNRPLEGSRKDLPESALSGAERNAAYTRQHVLMGVQEILDTYGLPDHVAVGNDFNASQGATTIWYYMQDRSRAFSIGFFDDRVVWVKSN